MFKKIAKFFREIFILKLIHLKLARDNFNRCNPSMIIFGFSCKFPKSVSDEASKSDMQVLKQILI